MLEWSIRAVLACPDISRLCVVIHDDDRAAYDTATAPISDPRLMSPAIGGATRALSVRSGLAALADAPPANVLIHDAARPFLSRAVIDRVIGALAAHDGAFPSLPVVDALWSDDLAPVPRDGLNRAQTPQGFRFAPLVAAHETAADGAVDDVTVALAAGLDVVQVAGEERNFKVTTAEDLARASEMMMTTPDIRTGIGYDVHAFAPGDSVTLCGITLPHHATLSGHSDADVAMHALTDAIYGALAEGDIGQWFPPSDPQWKGAASDIFLAHAMERVAHHGFRLTHMDVTIICEAPKIGPHADAMRARLAEITGTDATRISVKATTSERLGFTGREEGIAATATATLVRP